MTDEIEFRPKNQETNAFYNAEPGIAIVPGSNFAREVSKFEQFHSKYTAGFEPGNPYRYREYPKMLYRAQEYNGKVCCMAAPPNGRHFSDMAEHARAVDEADQFTRECQFTVNNEQEEQKAKENGWRNHPDEAVAYLLGRQRAQGQAAAERNYSDRNMSELAKREAERIVGEAGEHLGAIPEQPKKKRGRPRKNPVV